MEVCVPKASVTTEARKDDSSAFYQLVSYEHMELVQKLFDKIRCIDSTKYSGESLVEVENLKSRVDNITNNFSGYSDSLFIQNLEHYYDGCYEPEYELSLYSHNRELRWGSTHEQFRDYCYADSFIEETLELLINKL